MNIERRIQRRTLALEKQIHDLHIHKPTNTCKRQEEARVCDAQLDACRQEKEVLEHLGIEAGTRSLTQLEKNLLTGAFYADMRSLYRRRRFHRETGLTSTINVPDYDDSRLARLNRAGISTAAELNVALDTFEALVEKAAVPTDPTEHRLRDLMFRARLRQGKDIQFTPMELAREMVALSEISSESRVLEPEAGVAAIADEARRMTEHVDCIEWDCDFRELLELKGYPLVGRDLLETAPTPYYDAVLMNPPFSAECTHIRHAFEFLKPDGVLVALCSGWMENPRGRQYRDFYRWLDPLQYRFKKAVGKFEATSVSTEFLIIRRGSLALPQT